MIISQCPLVRFGIELNEIWDRIKGMVETKGKTPKASLNVIILGQCVDSPLSKFTQKNNKIFKIVGHPMKFQLTNYMPTHIKETMTKNGFITIDMLKEILAKNNINIEL